MKILFFFISPFALNQKAVIVDSENKEYYQEKQFSITELKDIGLNLINNYDIGKIIFKGPLKYTKRIYNDFKEEITTKYNYSNIEFELKGEKGETI